MSDGGGSNLGRGCLLLLFLAGVVGVVGVAAGMLLFAPVSGPAPGPVVEAPVVQVAPGVGPSTGPVAAPAGGAVAAIRARGVLRVGMDTGEPPFTGTPPMYFPNARGEPDGFDVALARRLQQAVGAGDLKVVHAKYSGLEDLARSADDVDVVISGYAATDGAGLAFSEPYFEYGLCLVVSSRSKIRTTQDLFGKKIGIFDDDAAAEEVAGLVKGYTDLVRLEDGYWDQLAEGRFDAFLYDYPYTVAELNQWYKANPSRQGSLRIAQYNLTDSSYVVMLRAADADLLDVVNRTIREWRASPDYAEAVRTYLKGGLAVEPPKGAKVHVVKPGETLSIIAAAELGSVEKWPALWEKNRDRFPNPHLIDVGDEVVLP
jgi:ABC-type amino acid transport substrate-binding protein